MVAVPFVFSSGQTIDYAQLNANNDALEAATANLTNAAIAPNAGITSDKLADRYAIIPGDPIMLVPLAHTTALVNASDTNADLFTCPNAATTLYQQRIALATGQEAYLYEVEFYVQDAVTAVTADPQITVQINGTTIGGGSVTITGGAAFWRLRNANPIANPLVALNDGDTLAVQFGRSDASGSPLIGGVWMRLSYKVRISA